MWISKTDFKRIKKPYPINGYPMQIWGDESILNTLGIYKAIVVNSTADKRYYNISESIDYNTATISYVATEKSPEEVKVRMVKSIKDTFMTNQKDPVVDTGLGFSVDGSYESVKNFEIGKKYTLPSVKASDNTFHNVTDADYDTIISAIEVFGVTLFQIKWTKESEVQAMTTLDELKAYEKSPYAYLRPVEEFVDETDADGVVTVSAKGSLETYGIELGIDLNKTYTLENMYQELVDSGFTETRYTNKCTEW